MDDPQTMKGRSISAAQIAIYRQEGHLTLPGIFATDEMDAAIRDIEAWGEDFLADLPPEKRAWYVDGGVTASTVLRKLDDPVFYRPSLRRLAEAPILVGIVEAIIGRGVTAYFSQIFFKAPNGGGPKPVHQDNYYFGPNNEDGVITAWIALDDATLENGCLYYGKGSNLGVVYPHEAPVNEPYNLQVPDRIARLQPMSPAPVPKGGVSLHHGNTLHQSSDNRSTKWRRACAVHYVQNETFFANPNLPYDASRAVRIT